MSSCTLLFIFNKVTVNIQIAHITEFDKKPVEELEDACCCNDKVACLSHGTH